jgi:hypothetical protein
MSVIVFCGCCFWLCPSGEGIPDLLQLMVKLTQTMMQDRLMLLSETQCTVGVRFVMGGEISNVVLAASFCCPMHAAYCSARFEW